MEQPSQPNSASASNPRGYPERLETCDKHGDFTARNYLGKIWSKCSQCEADARAESAARALAAERKERIDWRMRRSGLAGRFLDATFDNYRATTADQQTVLQRCRDYVAEFDRTKGGGLWLIGPPGTGKTHLGSAIVHALIHDHDTPAQIHSAREIIRMLRATWGKRESGGYTLPGHDYPTTEEALIEDLGTTPLLVLDEVGVQFGTDAEGVQLFDVLDLRYKYRLPTVLLSNVLAKDLKGLMGDRAYDRLREDAELIPCNWPSNRTPMARPWATQRAA